MLLSVSVSSFSIFCYLLTTVICKSIRISQCSTYSIISIGLHFIILYYIVAQCHTLSGIPIRDPLLIKSHYILHYLVNISVHMLLVKMRDISPICVYCVYSEYLYLVQCPTATKATYHGSEYSHTKQHKKHE